MKILWFQLGIMWRHQMHIGAKNILPQTAFSRPWNFWKTSSTEIVVNWLEKVSWGLNHLQTNSISFTHINFQVLVSMISSNFDQSSSKVNSGQTSAHFEKPKEVYTQQEPKNNNLSHISHIYYILRESRTSWNLIFPDSRSVFVGDIFFKCKSQTDEEKFQKIERGFYSRQSDIQKTSPYFTQVSQIGIFKEIFEFYFSIFMISCSRHVFEAHVPAIWRWIWRNRERFFFTMILSTKKILIFYTTIMVWDLQVALWSLFFHVNDFQTKCFFICNRFGNERTHCLYKMWRDTYVSGLEEVQEHLFGCIKLYL